MHIKSCGRDNSYNLIGTCSNQIIYVLSFMLDQEPFVVVLFLLVGRHNSDLLMKLVLPDGNKFCQNNALPTRDRLFDGKTLLKIWNLNRACPQCYKSMSGLVSSNVVEWEQKDRDIYQRTEKFSVHLHKSDNLSIPDSEEIMNITLKPSSSEMVSRVLDYE
ncbi:STACHYOSE SYNTHASE-LIKE [Salix viminalis]|uniref:STACHYOSE SYNTHASE-LIKE n=1 Tax=Salix viminalis TaxID=40686 RepID=A0A9Q0U005_SALVM|nr:STACHYOSE SYNTHASE-LIKE [Salix viminalis]